MFYLLLGLGISFFVGPFPGVTTCGFLSEFVQHSSSFSFSLLLSSCSNLTQAPPNSAQKTKNKQTKKPFLPG
jgi:hypothetical protein